MTDNTDYLTVLTCLGENVAAKQFICMEDGTIQKQNYNAGKLFTHEQKEVSGLECLFTALTVLSNDPSKFVIRGALREDAATMVLRRSNGDGAAFDPCPRRWGTLDIDKLEYPPVLDVETNPDKVIQFIKNSLPEPFKSSQCVYKFSSSQNVPEKIGEACKQKVSVHLWYWCDRLVSDQEWKAFFKQNPCSVDCSLFTPVQPHFTANPIFIGMNDPLSKGRIGLC